MEAAIAGPVLSALAGSAASAVIGGMFSKKPKETPATAIPEAPPPTVMPDPLAQKAQARRKAAVFSDQRMSAASTVLTGDRLG